MGLGDLFGGGKSAGASVWGPQADQLESLYGRANLASYGNQGQLYGQQFQAPALQGYQNQVGGGNQIDPTALQGIASGQTQNQNLQGAIQSGLGDISRNFNQNIMPGINMGSAMSNTSGGSRQGIAQGLAAGEANRQASDFVTKMQSQNYQQGLQSQLGANQGLMQNAAMQNQATQAGMGMAPSLSNLGFGTQYGDLQNLAGILGGPTVLGGGSKQNSSIFAPISL